MILRRARDERRGVSGEGREGGRRIDPARLQASLVELLSYPSPQAEMDRVRAFIAEMVKPRLRPELFDQITTDRQGNLVARRNGPAGSKPFLVLTYGASYPAEGMADPYPARVLGEPPNVRIRGRGSAEQRPGLAAAIEAVTTFLASAPWLSRGLDFATCVAGEMGNHLVVADLVETHRVDPYAAVVAVSSNNQLCLGNLGRVDVHVTVHGRTAHSSDPSAGVSALNGARILLNRLAELPLERVDPELGRATLVATLLETEPRAAHTVPGRARLTLDRRLLPGEEISEAIAEIEACARDLAGCQAEVVAGHFNHPNKVSPGAEVARRTLEAMAAAGLEARSVYKRSAQDAGFFTRRGADCVVFGPGDPRLGHSAEEWVAMSQVVQAAEAYQWLFELMCCGDA